ncbi:DUF1990 family protein [Microbacterium sp. P02]|uniref:DUF1990 family protein n=1 Tax=unclassified Microbacterium TaxID=2609290 RepID=UPI00366C058E
MPDVTYPEVGATAGALPAGYRHVRVERLVGRGREDYEQTCDLLLAGQAQRRAGAIIRLSQVPLRTGTYVRMLVRIGPLGFRIPCVVVWAERTTDLCGFAYGTLPGHPERGEERFELRLRPSGEVVFRITAFSAPGRWFTRLGGPVARLVQTTMTRRYLRALDMPSRSDGEKGFPPRRRVKLPLAVDARRFGAS